MLIVFQILIRFESLILKYQFKVIRHCKHRFFLSNQTIPVIIDIEFTNRLIVEENPTVEELKAWIPRSGLPVKKFFNTSGLVYKELKLSEKLPAMSEEEQIALLATNGKLVKRPLVVTDSFVLVGFKPDEWEKLK